VQDPQLKAAGDRSLEPKTGEDIFSVVLTCIYILLGKTSIEKVPVNWETLCKKAWLTTNNYNWYFEFKTKV
jgi:hypothetical protein